MELVPVYNDVLVVCYVFEYILSLNRVNVCLKICVNSGRKSVKPFVKNAPIFGIQFSLLASFTLATCIFHRYTITNTY